MSTLYRREVCVFGSTNRDAETDSAFMIALPVDSPGEVIDISDENVSEIMRDFEVVSDSLVANRSFRRAAANVLEVAQVKFFSQASGVRVIEIAEFAEGLTAPIQVRYLIRIDGDDVVLETSPNQQEAIGTAINEEDRLLHRMRVGQATSPSPRAGKIKI